MAIAILPLGGCLFGDDPPELVIFVDKALAAPLNELVNAYREAHDDDLPYDIRIVSGDGAELAARINGEQPVAPAPVAEEPAEPVEPAEPGEQAEPEPPLKADLFLPLRHADLVHIGDRAVRTAQVAEMVPTVLVHDKFEKGLDTFADLAKPNVRLAIGDKSKVAIGEAAEALMDRTEKPTEFHRHVIYRTETAEELVHLVRVGWADAAIIWKHMLKSPEAAKSTEMPLPDDLIDPTPITLAETDDGKLPVEASALAAYLGKAESRAVFARHGFGIPVDAMTTGDAVSAERDGNS
ncbi:MAG: substrate-binding domain-containing protein [Gammaproteobacteria bacterium]|nr:substrate-binding domain-containing protein [Gammaproteobacteria bacterium]